MQGGHGLVSEWLSNKGTSWNWCILSWCDGLCALGFIGYLLSSHRLHSYTVGNLLSQHSQARLLLRPFLVVVRFALYAFDGTWSLRLPCVRSAVALYIEDVTWLAISLKPGVVCWYWKYQKPLSHTYTSEPSVCAYT